MGQCAVDSKSPIHCPIQTFMNAKQLGCLLTALIASAYLVSPGYGQIQILGEANITGVIESVASSSLVVKDSDGKVHTILIVSGDAIAGLSSGVRLRTEQTSVSVSGEFAVAELTPGQLVQIETRLKKAGNSEGVVSKLELVDTTAGGAGIEVLKEGPTPADFADVRFTGPFIRMVKSRMILSTPANNGFTRRAQIAVDVADDAIVSFTSNDFRKAKPGANVTSLSVVRLNTGDSIARSIEIETTSAVTSHATLDSALNAKYAHLSDEPMAPRLIRSPHYAFMSDVSDREAKVILDKLEVMTILLSKYFGKAPTGIVKGFVVRDLSRWPDGLIDDDYGLEKIRRKEGVCITKSLGSTRDATLYSYADHGTIQHECTHGFCGMTFGSTGPTWLSEGVAEMGAYWKAGQREVDIDPAVMGYLQNASPKRKLLEIAIPGRTASGAWQDYAWRWALVHLLANNPNYENRFKPLAVALMEGRDDVSFRSVYGPVAPNISFEYDLFLQHVGNGYRADLCAWQWNEKFAPLKPDRRLQKTVIAKYGWQASNITVEKGVSYDLAAIGNWKIAQDGSEVSADGDSTGRGKLVGVLLSERKLLEPFEIGARSRWVAPYSGDLYFRCQEDLTKISDNDGEVTVHIRLTPTE